MINKKNIIRPKKYRGHIWSRIVDNLEKTKTPKASYYRYKLRYIFVSLLIIFVLTNFVFINYSSNQTLNPSPKQEDLSVSTKQDSTNDDYSQRSNEMFGAKQEDTNEDVEVNREVTDEIEDDSCLLDDENNTQTSTASVQADSTSSRISSVWLQILLPLFVSALVIFVIYRYL